MYLGLFIVFLTELVSQMYKVIVLSSFLVGINKKRSLFSVLSGVLVPGTKVFLSS